MSGVGLVKTLGRHVRHTASVASPSPSAGVFTSFTSFALEAEEEVGVALEASTADAGATASELLLTTLAALSLSSTEAAGVLASSAICLQHAIVGEGALVDHAKVPRVIMSSPHSESDWFCWVFFFDVESRGSDLSSDLPFVVSQSRSHAYEREGFEGARGEEEGTAEPRGRLLCDLRSERGADR